MNEFGGYEEPTSRAFWGSEDLEENPTPDPTFSLEWLTDTPSLIKKLVVVAGDLVTAIAEKRIVHNAERVCTINTTAEFNVAAVFRLTDELYVCTAKSSSDIKLTGELIDTISDILSQAEIIIAFTDANMSKFQGAVRNIASTTLWRSLSTRKGREDCLSKVPSLEHPNFIAGLAAGVSAPVKKWHYSLSLPTAVNGALSMLVTFLAGISKFHHGTKDFTAMLEKVLRSFTHVLSMLIVPLFAVVAYAEMMSLPATVYIMYAADDVYDTETVEPMIKLFSDVTDYAVPKIDHNIKTLNSDKLKLYI